LEDEIKGNGNDEGGYRNQKKTRNYYKYLKMTLPLKEEFRHIICIIKAWEKTLKRY
jgi:hypothetical protein